MTTKSYIIAGPTASGKSDFAHALARRMGGAIINADSVQVYKGIEHLSASPLADKPDDDVPYALYSITRPESPLSAGEWARMARAEYDRAIAAGRVPIFVGGAGFYLAAIMQGFSDIPKISADARERARSMPGAYEFLQKQDPEWAAKIAPGDTQRIARGVEVFLETGRPLSEWQRRPRVRVLPAEPRKVLLLPPRDVVRQRIADRMPALARKVIDEVRAIMDLPRELPVMRADGVLEIAAYLRGEISYDAAVERWRMKIIRGNMKRQYTWFRTQFSADVEISRAPADADIEHVLQK
jgi:tRNA dimethylallyltransferase